MGLRLDKKTGRPLTRTKWRGRALLLSAHVIPVVLLCDSGLAKAASASSGDECHSGPAEFPVLSSRPPYAAGSTINHFRRCMQRAGRLVEAESGGGKKGAFSKISHDVCVGPYKLAGSWLTLGPSSQAEALQVITSRQTFRAKIEWPGLGHWQYPRCWAQTREFRCAGLAAA